MRSGTSVGAGRKIKIKIRIKIKIEAGEEVVGGSGWLPGAVGGGAQDGLEGEESGAVVLEDCL